MTITPFQKLQRRGRTCTNRPVWHYRSYFISNNSVGMPAFRIASLWPPLVRVATIVAKLCRINPVGFVYRRPVTSFTWYSRCQTMCYTVYLVDESMSSSFMRFHPFLVFIWKLLFLPGLTLPTIAFPCGVLVCGPRPGGIPNGRALLHGCPVVVCGINLFCHIGAPLFVCIVLYRIEFTLSTHYCFICISRELGAGGGFEPPTFRLWT